MLVVVGILLALLVAAVEAKATEPPPLGAAFDYQIGAPYPPRPGTKIVTRDWFEGRPLDRPGAYSVCYVNAFQTQPDDPSVERPDERSSWPAGLVLSELGDDPEWEGEFLIDISSADRRRAAAAWVEQMIETCSTKGFDAVEYDNLDSWTRLRDFAGRGAPSFGRTEALSYARLITAAAHRLGLAVAQKNTPQLSRRQSRRRVGFDFAVAEQCGRYRECGDYRRLFGRRVLAVEYGGAGLRRTCRRFADRWSIVLRDVDVAGRGEPGYRHRTC